MSEDQHFNKYIFFFRLPLITHVNIKNLACDSFSDILHFNTLSIEFSSKPLYEGKRIIKLCWFFSAVSGIFIPFMHHRGKRSTVNVHIYIKTKFNQSSM